LYLQQYQLKRLP